MFRDSGYPVQEWSDPTLGGPEEMAVASLGQRGSSVRHRDVAAVLAHMNPQDRICYYILAKAAEADEPCPRNEVMCLPLGYASGKGVANTIKRLENAGLIKVERYSHGRAVVITDTAKHTRRPNCLSKHWREVGAVGSSTNKTTPIVPEVLPPIVDRDPCPRCGVRADVGCGHHASRLIVRQGAIA